MKEYIKKGFGLMLGIFSAQVVIAAINEALKCINKKLNKTEEN